MTDCRTLLREYALKRSEEAFRELTSRYIHLVYSTAIRLMNGDVHRAEDVVQTVFFDLARLADTLSPEVMLGGWLHRRACHVAANFIRSERRRQNRERQAAEMNALQEPDPNLNQILPVLDDAINHLNATDRAAILLRFFEGRDLGAIGAALGTSEDAAQKRVSRALAKLRVLLTRRGVTASAALLVSVLSSQSANLAPSALAASVSIAALAGASAKSGIALTLLKLAAMTKTKVGAAVAAVAAVGTIFVIEYPTLTALRHEHQALQQELSQQMAQEGGRQSESEALLAAKPTALTAAQLAELETLRRDVAAYRKQSSGLAALQAGNSRLRAALRGGGNSTDPAEADFQHETRRRIQDLKKWGLMFRVHANDHGGQFPDNWEQVAEQIPETERASFLEFARQNYEIAYHGKEESISNRWSGILFREKQARQSPSGKWFKVYGHLDGSASTLTQPPVNFSDFEKQNMVPSQ